MTSMDLFEVISTRRSVRRFRDESVPAAIIERIIECANYAPSACNLQGWRFIVIDKKELQKEIVDRGGSDVITSAPVGILACYDNRTDNVEYNDWLQSGAAAIQNMLLCAHALGLGGCWICHLPRHKTLRALLDIPPHYTPVAYVAIGYPADITEPVRRYRSVKELYDRNRFPPNGSTYSIRLPAQIIKRFVRKFYYVLPKVLKKGMNPFIHRYLVKKFDN